MLIGYVFAFALASFGSAENTDCKTDQFSCITTSQCVARSALCNGVSNCADDSDEIQPYCVNITNTYFDCGDGNRKLSWQVCDGQVDCPDASDESEQLCSGSTCHANQFQCQYGACLFIGSMCDGVKHCADGSDEAESNCGDKQCKTDEYRCPNGICLNKRKVCDGRRDCADGSDELQPYCQKIKRGIFQCADGVKKHNWQICDGKNDCRDGSDEREEVCANSTCHQKQFQCSYGACLHSGAACDAIVECADGTDESAATCFFKNKCEKYQFRCTYGACVDEILVCDGKQDCRDNSDELLPYCRNITGGVFNCPNGTQIPSWRVCDGRKDCPDQSDEVFELCGDINCHQNQFQCDSGGCLHSGAECDGNKDCFDGSDEYRLVCRVEQCSFGEFRCSYGACVSADSFCDGYRDCDDGSDEYHPFCKLKKCEKGYQFRCASGGCVKVWPCLGNEGCIPMLRSKAQDHMETTYFRCQDGSTIPAGDICDGVDDCSDKSDEDRVLCSNIKHRCADGTCRYSFPKTACDGVPQCDDKSDESINMCGNIRCSLPPQPEHGHYNSTNMLPNQVVKSLMLVITCDEGYAVVDGDDEIFCNNGNWSTYPLPSCIRYCTLEEDPDIVYRCIDQYSESGESRSCRERELSGTIALPTCDGPNYYSPHALPHMTCVNGTWDATPNCTSECGKVTPSGQTLIAGGRYIQHGELPWFAGIYEKEDDKYTQICGGSLVNRDVIISAAHCFWGYNKILRRATRLPAENYAVAVGKLYQAWNHSNDQDVQRSDVSELIFPSEFDGFTKNLQADIVIVIVANAFTYKPHIHPVCLSFDPDFDSKQLLPGTKGKIAGWGLTTASGEVDTMLKVVELPIIDNEECNNRFPADFKEYLTLDKFCVGYWNQGKAICRGDSGGGLAFPETYNGVERYYLRGIASAQPRRSDSFDLCNINAYSVMTQIIKHETFIKQNL